MLESVMDRREARHPQSHGFTLVELLVVIAVAVLLIALVGPSFRETIDRQRVNSTNTQFVTDMQFARSEAAARGQYVRVTFGSDATRSCYVIYTYDTDPIKPGHLTRCNCLATPACTATGSTEIRTTSVPKDTRIMLGPLAPPNEFAFEPTTGQLFKIPTDFHTPSLNKYEVDTYIDAPRRLRTILALSGRPTVCTPAGSKMRADPC